MVTGGGGGGGEESSRKGGFPVGSREEWESHSLLQTENRPERRKGAFFGFFGEPTVYCSEPFTLGAGSELEELSRFHHGIDCRCLRKTGYCLYLEIFTLIFTVDGSMHQSCES